MSCGLRQGELTTLNGSEHVVYPQPILMGKNAINRHFLGTLFEDKFNYTLLVHMKIKSGMCPVAYGKMQKKLPKNLN